MCCLTMLTMNNSSWRKYKIFSVLGVYESFYWTTQFGLISLRTFGQCCIWTDEVGPWGTPADRTIPLQAEKAHGKSAVSRHTWCVAHFGWIILYIFCPSWNMKLNCSHILAWKWNNRLSLSWILKTIFL